MRGRVWWQRGLRRRTLKMIMVAVREDEPEKLSSESV